MRRHLIALSAVTLSFSLAACGSSDVTEAPSSGAASAGSTSAGSTSSSSSTSSAPAKKLTVTELGAALITAEDAPAGFKVEDPHSTSSTSSRTKSSTASKGGCDVDGGPQPESVADLEMGRVKKKVSGQVILVAVQQYASEDDAKTSISMMRKLGTECTTLPGEDMTFSPLDAGTGPESDDRFAVASTKKIDNETGKMELFMTRIGSVVVTTTARGLKDPVPTAERKAVEEKQVAKVKTALGR